LLGRGQGDTSVAVAAFDDLTVTAGGAPVLRCGFDARGKSGAYNAVWQSATARTADGWSVEMRLPFAAVEHAPPAPAERWRIGLGRTEPNRGAWELSCGPVFAARDFHLPQSYAPVI
jgi:hypothetical protein